MAITKLITGSITDETITSAKIDDGAITNAKINASAGISISKTVFTGAQPTISALSISQKDPDVSSNVTITGTNFESIPIVQFLNTTTGARITSATVTYTSSTSITAVFPASQTVGIYKVIVENPTSLSVISTATIINSAAPNWVTNASLGSVEEGETVNIQLLAYDDDSSAVSSYSLQSGSLPSGVTLSGDSTVGALTGTAPQVAADTAYNFTVRATDNESQTTDKAFSLTIADYNIGNSLMFNDNDSANLTRTTSGTATNSKKCTFSFWVKRGNLGVQGQLFSAGSSEDRIGFSQVSVGTDSVEFVFNNTGSGAFFTSDNGSFIKFRDTSAWYHFVVAIDTTLATADDRLKFYQNGNLIPHDNAISGGSAVSGVPITQNYDLQFLTSGNNFSVGRNTDGSGEYLDGYMGEIHFVDGQQLTPTNFGETNSNGVWIPKKYTGTYGNYGFALEFDDSSDFGTDTSGNGNDFTANNLASTDQSQDSPHLNYATMNPLAVTSAGTATFSQGNLQVATVTNGSMGGYCNIHFPPSGKWYCEAKITTSSPSNAYIGIVEYDSNDSNSFTNSDSTFYYGNGQKYVNGSASSYGSAWSQNDIIGMAVNADDNEITFYLNGVSQGTLSETIDGKTWNAGDTNPSVSHTFQWNFGSPIHSISSGNSDGNGYGNFEYAVPTGFYALNSKNLATYG